MSGGTNNNGYHTALDKGFSDLGEENIPTPSALCQFRRTISSDFFKDLFKDTLSAWKSSRPKWKGLFLNAIDGDQLTLPVSESILVDGYRGFPIKDGKETYFPVMYTCWATDLITGVPTSFSYSNKNDEISRAIEILSNYDQPEKTLTVYDRFYLSTRLLDSYKKYGGFFVARCKLQSTFSEVVKFGKSTKKEETVSINEMKCRLIKFTPDSSKEEIVLATNLPKRFKKNDIIPTYGYRWESETSNRDRTSSLKLDQFRAKDINGILQEVYSTLILQAITRIICANETNPKKDFMQKYYEKSNFKAVSIKVIDHIGSLLKNKSKSIFGQIQRLIIVSKEKRSRYSRYCDRIVRRSPGKQYDLKSTIPRRE